MAVLLFPEQSRLTLVFDLEQVFSAEILIRSIGPEVLAHNLVQLLSKGFRKAVSYGLYHDVIVIVPLQQFKEQMCMKIRYQTFCDN